MVLARGPLHLRVSNSMPIPSQAWREYYLIDIFIGIPHFYRLSSSSAASLSESRQGKSSTVKRSCD